MKRYNLKFWRMKQGQTQAEIAAKLGISAGHYKGIENGKYDPSKKIFDRFCNEFEMDESKIKKLFKKEEDE